jgi:long-chain acyl-CoA synthetase
MDARGISAIARAEPERTALIVLESSGKDRAITFRELEARINCAASSLRAAGVMAVDRVAVMLENCAEVFAIWNAIARLGAYVVPVSYRSTPRELAYLIADSDAKVLIHEDRSLAERAVALLERSVTAIHVGDSSLWSGNDEPPTDDFLGTPVSWMSYTSGTTGRPKGIERPRPQPMSSPTPNPYMTFWGFGASDVHLLAGPAYHTAPGAWAQMHLVEGAAVVIMPRWDAADCLRAIDRHRVTNSHLVPANFIRILELERDFRARYDLTSIRKILHGAAACPAAVKRQIMDVFPPGTVWEYYGASEGMGTIISPEEWQRKPGSVGRPFPGLGIRILDDAGDEAAPNIVGTIYLRPASGFEPQYRNAPDKTKAAYQDGFFTVGDLGWKDEDGYLYIADRRTDLILRGGVNIYPAEVESALAEHPGVVDAAVFGLPDPVLGQIVYAVVELRPGAPRDPQALRAFLTERLSDFKVPRTIEIVDALPREPNGKIKKQDLRDARRP